MDHVPAPPENEMEQSPDTDTLTAYLLGELADDEAASLEDALFTDDALFERARAAETDLIDAYAAGALSDRRAAAFERRLLATAEQRERVAFARALAARVDARRAADAPAPERDGWWRRLMSLVGTRVLAVAGAAALAIVIGLQVMGTGAGGDDAEPAAVTLQPARLRAASAVATVDVPPGTDVVHVALELGDDAHAARYRVALLDDGNGTRTAYEPTAADASRVTAAIPAADLGTGRRTLALTDGDGNDLAYYEVIVRRH
jgi:anti-sigma factor RsiW